MRSRERVEDPEPERTVSFQQFSLERVLSEFHLKIEDSHDFLAHAQPVSPGPNLSETLREYAKFALAYKSEAALREFIIGPILMESRRRSQAPFQIFPGATLNADEKRGLNGYCDYVLAFSPTARILQHPVVAVVEAKKEDLESGEGQCAAALVAVQMLNDRQNHVLKAVYGIITTGSDWRILKLEGSTLMFNPTLYQLADLPALLGALIHLVEIARPEPSS